MNIPDTIKIGAHIVRIIIAEEVFDKDRVPCAGMSYPYINEIQIAQQYAKKELPESAIADTLLHETLHIVSEIYGIGLREAQVMAIAGALLQVIRDNKLDFSGRE